MLDGIVDRLKTAVRGKNDAAEGLPRVSPDDEFEIIKKLLGRKFGVELKERIRLDGYLDQPEYRLVLVDDARRHSVWGASVQDILALKSAFVDMYWREIGRIDKMEKQDAAGQLDDWDKDRLADIKKTAVAGSREEMLLRAAAEGLL